MASHKLFVCLLRDVVRSPMMFFEQTPTGDLLNRFSKEMDSIDSIIPDKMKSLLGFVFHLLEIYIAIIVATPIAVVAIVPLTALYAVLQVRKTSIARPSASPLWQTSKQGTSLTKKLSQDGARNQCCGKLPGLCLTAVSEEMDDGGVEELFSASFLATELVPITAL